MIMSEGFKVFIRVRPPIRDEAQEKTVVFVQGKNHISVNTEKHDVNCAYDHVFQENTTQEEIFDAMYPLVGSVLNGINTTIFTSGQTSAGKSYTMIGPDGGQNLKFINPIDRGIIPRISEYLMNELADRADRNLLTYTVKVSFMQLYNENIYDLLRVNGPILDPSEIGARQRFDTSSRLQDLKLHEIPNSNNTNNTEVYISGLSEYRVQTSNDILLLLNNGMNNRTTNSTDYNQSSSRSHAILQITFDITNFTNNSNVIITKSKLSLIDLAGSEKMSNYNMETTKKHIKELTSINKSLSCLGNVISALSSKTKVHIPYRDSKLTRLLQDSLGGNTKTILIACVAPTVIHCLETLNTLQFADRAKNIMIKIKPNIINNNTFNNNNNNILLLKAENEINRLKQLLNNALKQSQTQSIHSINDHSNLNMSMNSNSSEELIELREINDLLRHENHQLKQQLEKYLLSNNNINENQKLN